MFYKPYRIGCITYEIRKALCKIYQSNSFFLGNFPYWSFWILSFGNLVSRFFSLDNGALRRDMSLPDLLGQSPLVQALPYPTRRNWRHHYNCVRVYYRVPCKSLASLERLGLLPPSLESFGANFTRLFRAVVFTVPSRLLRLLVNCPTLCQCTKDPAKKQGKRPFSLFVRETAFFVISFAFRSGQPPDPPHDLCYLP